MKKYSICLLILAITLPALRAENRLYFNITTGDGWSWNSTGDTNIKGAGNFAYFFNEQGHNAWSEHAICYSDSIYYIVIPTGDWTHFTLTRNKVSTNPTWDNVWSDGSGKDQTGDLTFSSGNYVRLFFKGSQYCEWGYVPYGEPSEIMAITEDHVCQSAIGQPYTLERKDTTMHNCGWFQYMGNKIWKEMAPGITYDSTYFVVSISNAYYYLGGEPLESQRLIHIMPDQDCQLTCEITSFDMVSSAVNVLDSTYAIDGLIAFAKADSKLVISYDGEQKVTANQPTSPYIFKLPALKADGQSHTVSALIDNQCTATYTITAPVPSTRPTSSPIDCYVGDAVVIRPANRDSITLDYSWSDGCPTHDRVIQFDHDTTFELLFTAYNRVAPTGDLISNGSFEDDVDYKTYSEYVYWGRGDSLNNYYEAHPDTSGGFVTVKSAQKFAKTFADVHAHHGDWFALFDADNTGAHNAWQVSQNPQGDNLTIEKDMNYMFSFWVCNINNFGEMDNCAKLQFFIHYTCDEGTFEQPLGEVIDLADYHDNLWHQNSAIFTATTSGHDVQIMVKDLNTSLEYVGNDFGLDDIRFQAISVRTRVMKAQEIYKIIYHLPQDIRHDLTLCNRDNTTLSATPEPSSASYYKWINGSTSRNIAYSHSLTDMDSLRHDNPDFLDTLVCHSYNQQNNLICTDSFLITIQPCYQCDDTLLLSKWDDVLLVQNQSQQYIAYQWLKNSQILPDETKQFLNVALYDKDALYACLVTTTTGDRIYTCNRKVDDDDPASHPKKIHTAGAARKYVANGTMYIEVDGIKYSILGTLQ